MANPLSHLRHLQTSDKISKSGGKLKANFAMFIFAKALKG